MKKILITFIVLLSAASIASDHFSDYCSGWKEGWKEGWCYKYTVPSMCIAPPAPVCPVPEAGRTRWVDGYNDGFKEGAKANK